MSLWLSIVLNVQSYRREYTTQLYLRLSTVLQLYLQFYSYSYRVVHVSTADDTR